MDNYSMIYEYMMKKSEQLENEVIQTEHNVFGRNVDSFDAFEALVARCRLETAEEIFADLYRVLKIIRGVNNDL